MKTKEEIKHMIEYSEIEAAELSFELNALEQREYEEQGPVMGDKLSKLEGKIDALKWVIRD